MVLTMGIAFTTQAQKKDKENKRRDFNLQQKRALAVKKMTLRLDLTESQISQIEPLLNEQIKDRMKMREERKALKENDTKLTSDEQYALATEKLDKQIAFKKEMKLILDEKQYERFEKMLALRKGKKGKKKKKENT